MVVISSGTAPTLLQRPQHPSQNPPDKLPRKTLSRLTGASPEPNTARYIHCGGHDPGGGRSLVFFFCFFFHQQKQPQHRLDIPTGGGLVCAAAVLDQMREPVCPRARDFANKKKTLPISPCRTETVGAFQQLDLMRFHHQQGVRGDVSGSHLGKLHCLSATVFIDFSRVQASVQDGGDSARLRCGDKLNVSRREKT